ncbi:Flp pilus assembly protein TadG [Arthrobacter globiformis]|nr:Flp pilus assembly protein TadG [Arthrobacter globiformis]
MPRSPADRRRGDSTKHVADRFREALCLGPCGTPGPRGSLCAQGTLAPGNAGGDEGQRGSAVVEFTFLGLLLMVPVVYFIITVGQIQGGSFAVVGAADQAAKVFVAQPDAPSGRAAAEQATLVALADYGHTAGNANVEIHCDSGGDCTAAGSAVTVTVRLTVPLPFVPFGEALRLDAGQLSASATQVVGRFR